MAGWQADPAPSPSKDRTEVMALKVLILGANGFIGSTLTETILNDRDWQVFGMDISDDKLAGTASPGPALTGVGVFHVGQPVPGEAADIELVVKQTGAARAVAVDCAGRPGSGARRADAVAVEVDGDLPRRHSGRVVAEHPLHDLGFGRVDLALTDADVPDPLLYFRQAWEDKDHKAHVLFATSVSAATCATDAGEDAAGVAISGDVDGVSLHSLYCPQGNGALLVMTRATGLPPGAEIADEVSSGTAEPTFAGVDIGWEGEHDTDRVTIAEYGLSMTISAASARAMKAERHLVHIANELFPSALFLRHHGAEVSRRIILAQAPTPARL